MDIDKLSKCNHVKMWIDHYSKEIDNIKSIIFAVQESIDKNSKSRCFFHFGSRENGVFDMSYETTVGFARVQLEKYEEKLSSLKKEFESL